MAVAACYEALRDFLKNSGLHRVLIPNVWIRIIKPNTKKIVPVHCTKNYIFFFQIFWKDGLSKKISRWNMIFFVLYGKMPFFSGKYDIFSLNWKWKIIFLKKYMKFWYFLYICINVTNMILPFCKKNQRWSSPEKMHLKVIDILDRILERVPTILCTFMETFIGVFIYCFPVKKTQET